jgi:flagellar capping protein FliD
MNSDEDGFYMKIVSFVEIYNFVVQSFSFEIILTLK